MDEMIKTYAEGILAAAGAGAIIGTLAVLFMQQASPLIQMITAIISKSF